MKHLLVIVLLITSALTAVWAMGRNVAAEPAPYDLDTVRDSLKPLTLTEAFKSSADVAQYLDFYGLQFTNATHYFGTVESEGSTIAAHVFIPTDAKGTLFLVHGFLDHTGTLSKLIEEGLDQGYAVVTWDLPGHGLSSGERTDTGAFDVCALQLTDLVQKAKGHLPRPFQLICHSTGCSIAIEVLHNETVNHFDRVVFLAPLVRHEQWGWAKFGYFIADPFSDGIKRKVRANSSDAAYLDFARNDPLVNDSVAFAYLDALYAWEKRVRDYEPIDEAVVIIQGEADKVVDWEHNMEELKELFPRAIVHTLPGARHQLANESEAYRAQVFGLVFGNE